MSSNWMHLNLIRNTKNRMNYKIVLILKEVLVQIIVRTVLKSDISYNKKPQGLQ